MNCDATSLLITLLINAGALAPSTPRKTPQLHATSNLVLHLFRGWGCVGVSSNNKCREGKSTHFNSHYRSCTPHAARVFRAHMESRMVCSTRSTLACRARSYLIHIDAFKSSTDVLCRAVPFRTLLPTVNGVLLADRVLPYEGTAVLVAPSYTSQ